MARFSDPEDREAAFKAKMDALDQKYPGASLYYDREGKPISSYQWVKTQHADRRVALTEVGGKYWVSTVWLGLDHSFGQGPPILFETMIWFEHEGPPSPILGNRQFDNMQERYHTEEEALVGHQAAVEQVRAVLEFLGDDATVVDRTEEEKT